jgi:hypothetical protein
MTFRHGDTTREAARRKRQEKRPAKRARKRPQLVPLKKRGSAPRARKPAAKLKAKPRPEFVLSRLSEYSDGALLAEIRRVAASTGGPVLTLKTFVDGARVSAATISNHFRTWHAALGRAGLAHLYSGPMGPDGPKHHVTRRMPDAGLLDLLRRMAREAGGDTITAYAMMRRGGPNVATFRRRFGSWANAMRAAGLRLGRGARRHTDADCFENLRAVWKFHGRQPTAREMREPPSVIGPDAYLRRFGRWNLALARFAQLANRGKLADPKGYTPPPAPAVQPRKQRTTPLHLRFQVLTRDNFRCTACGISPAIYPACRLQVDHILPASKGGATELGNLRTLCSLCNLGRGDGAGETLPAAAGTLP